MGVNATEILYFFLYRDFIPSLSFTYLIPLLHRKRYIFLPAQSILHKIYAIASVSRHQLDGFICMRSTQFSEGVSPPLTLIILWRPFQTLNLSCVALTLTKSKSGHKVLTLSLPRSI